MARPSVYSSRPSVGVVESTGASRHRGRPGGGQPATRLHRTEQDVGQRVPELHAREPHHQHRGDLVAPGQLDGRAGVDDHHGPRIDGGDGADELVLPAGQGQRRPVEALALHRVGGADDDDGDVAGPGELDGVRELLVGRPQRRPDDQADLEDEALGRPAVADADVDPLAGAQRDDGVVLRRRGEELVDVERATRCRRPPAPSCRRGRGRRRPGRSRRCASRRPRPA